MSVNGPQLTSNQRLKYIVSMLNDYRLFWLIPAIAGLLLSVAYIMFLKNDTWTARQSMVVRDDLLGQSFKPGRFESLETMKSAQETILEIAREPQVIRNALKKLGPQSMFGGGDWPSEKVIEQMQGAISLSAPNGAELGKTEVIVLNVKGSTRERSRELITLLFDEIKIKARSVRQMRMQSMVTEMEQAQKASKQVLDDSKARLRAMDKKFGGDIGSMGSYDQGGSANLQKDISQIQLEKRRVDTDIVSAEKVLDILVSARLNPDEIINISGDLMRYQPSLDVVKQALVAAQRELTVAQGTYTLEHPKVESAKESVEAMKTMIFNELASSVISLEKEIASLRLTSDRLENAKSLLEGRLTRVSSGRADAMTLIAEVKKRTEMANKAESELQEIQALASNATNFDLMTVVDVPQVPTKPDGLGKKPMIMAGSLGGLLFGLGLVMLIAPPMEDHAKLLRPSPSHAPENPAPTPSRETQPGATPRRSFDRPLAPVPASPAPVSFAPQTQSVQAPMAKSPAQNISSAAFASKVESKSKFPTPISIPPQRQLPAGGAATAKASQMPGRSSASTRPEPSFETASSKPLAASFPKELQTLEQKAENALNSVKSGVVQKESRPAVKTRVPDQTIAMEQVTTVEVPKFPTKGVVSGVGLGARNSGGNKQPVTSAMVDQAIESIQESHEDQIAGEPAGHGFSSEPSDLVRRQSARPADLAKSAESEEVVSPPGRRRVNPFLHKRDDAELEKARQEQLAANETAPSTPVPDQIKKLSQAISEFAKPMKAPVDPPQEQF